MTVNTADIGFMATMASIEACANQGIVDVNPEDIEFLTQEKPWTATERSRSRRVVESIVYGATDIAGLPRLAAPVEYIAAAIIYFVHPCNYMTACVFHEGAENVENIINGVDQPLTATQLFAHVIRCASGRTGAVENMFWEQKRANQLEEGEV